MLWAGIRWNSLSKNILSKSTYDSQFYYYDIFLFLDRNSLIRLFLGFFVVVFILFLITSNWRLLLRLLKNSIVAGIPMIISKSLVPGTCHNSLINCYVFVSFLSLGNFLLFILYTCKTQYGVIFDRIPWTMSLSYIAFIDAG